MDRAYYLAQEADALAAEALADRVEAAQTRRWLERPPRDPGSPGRRDELAELKARLREYGAVPEGEQ